MPSTLQRIPYRSSKLIYVSGARANALNVEFRVGNVGVELLYQKPVRRLCKHGISVCSLELSYSLIQQCCGQR